MTRGALNALRGRGGVLLALAIFWICALRNLELPGLYMDAINPDYMVAHWLHPGLDNPVWRLPGPALPILGNLYHGTQTLYLGVLTYGVLGTSVASARITHALFGALIVLLLWLTLRRVTARPWLSLALAGGLATDMAFLGSFRTQAYIILAGQVWMMSGVYFAVRATRAGSSLWTSLLCGVSLGLAVYGYFVFLFFLPPVALLAIVGSGREGALQRTRAVAVGFALGMLPYLFGYALLLKSTGGVHPFVEWMRSALAGLHPTGASPGYVAGVASALTNARLGLSGAGNELMMFGKTLAPQQAMIRPVLLMLVTVGCLVGACWQWRSNRQLSLIALAFAGLPVAYVLCAGGFGARMWAHHFTVLVAVLYLLAGAALHALLPDAKGLARSSRLACCMAGMVALLLLLAFNLAQQQRVQDRLVETGGTRMMTDALTVLSRSALETRKDTVWFFPEWGFFMPFAFLTGNEVAYRLELTPEALARERGSYREVRVAFWKESAQADYRRVLAEQGVGQIQSQVVLRRDGEPAIYLLSGRLKSE